MQKTQDFHANLRQRRKALRLTQEQLAQRMNISAQAVSKWEKSSYPDAEQLPKLAAALNISLDALFGLPAPDDSADPVQAVVRALHSLPSQARPEFAQRLWSAVFSAYLPSAEETPQKRNRQYERETYALLHTDYEIALARLNPDQRYFFYLEKPEQGIADYLQDTEGICRVLKTLADEDAIRIVRYIAGSHRNKLFFTEKLAAKLGIPEEKVQTVMNRLDRLGLVWRMAADSDSDPIIMYGYTNNPAVAGILVLAQSISSYLQFCDPKIDTYSFGSMQNRREGTSGTVPQVSGWDTDSI
jgi:transcriptional regulator with XRE-family HTH domain